MGTVEHYLATIGRQPGDAMKRALCDLLVPRCFWVLRDCESFTKASFIGH